LHTGHEHDNYELARAFINIQRYHHRWEPMEGLFRGTIFPELYRPYRPRDDYRSDHKHPEEFAHPARRNVRPPMRGGKRFARR
jgi:hypothetical protein